MYIKLAGGTVYDPVHGINAEKRDIYIHDGQITRKPNPDVRIDKTYDLGGKVVMAGAIDIHTHIGGGKVNIARLMLPEDHQKDPVKKNGPDPCGLRSRSANHDDNRLPLCRNGIYSLLRTCDVADQRPPGPYGNGRYPDG